MIIRRDCGGDPGTGNDPRDCGAPPTAGSRAATHGPGARVHEDAEGIVTPVAPAHGQADESTLPAPHVAVHHARRHVLAGAELLRGADQPLDTPSFAVAITCESNSVGSRWLMRWMS